MAKSNSAVQQRGGFGKFFRGVKAELKKVVWPTKKELINYTIVVFLVTIFIALIISVLDGLFAQLFNTLLHFVGYGGHYMEADKKWYVIHTYSGYENKVKTTLELKVQSMGLQDVISRILVPLEDEIDEKDGVKKVVKRKIFPGYVLVEMEVNDRSWYVVRNTPGVTGFVGSATKPVPLSDSEVEHILKSQGLDKKPTINVDVEVGETVRITSGAFEDKLGVITELNPEKGTLKLSVEMFNRDTEVELEFSQVEKAL